MQVLFSFVCRTYDSGFHRLLPKNICGSKNNLLINAGRAGHFVPISQIPTALFRRKIDITSIEYILSIYNQKEGMDVLTTTVTKWGNSQGVRIPRDILDDVKIVAGETVEIISEDGAIVIKKINKKKTIQELFAEYDGAYAPEEAKTGFPLGEEIW